MEHIEEWTEGDLRVRIMPDNMGDGSGDPRDSDTNLSVMVMGQRNYTLGDEKLEGSEYERALDHGGWRLLKRYLRMCKGAIAVIKIGMIDHSGISIYPVADFDQRGESPFDPGGWDSGIVGFAYITRDRWKEMMADADPFAPVDEEVSLLRGAHMKSEAVWAALRSEINEYDQYLREEVYGYIIERPHGCDSTDCPHDEIVDSCYGFLGFDYVKESAKEAAAFALAETGQA